LLALLQARNAWSVTRVTVLYDFAAVPVASAVSDLHTCWKGRPTFADLAVQIEPGATPDGPDMVKLVAMAAGLNGDDVLVPCF